MEKNTITLTERAANHVKRFLERRGTTTILRVAVKPTGCSGFKYVVQTADKTTETDKVFQSQGINIVVDANSLAMLDGTEVDYVRDGLNEGFRFNNPNVDQTCGCGESFTPKQASH
jgi:iron-sulfur cluster assembly protein